MRNEDLNTSISREASLIFDWVKEIREHIHKNPELSFQEFETSKYVCEKLSEIGIDNYKLIGGTGVVALITNETINQEKCIALRADLDALPISELNSTEYRSNKPGIMHACGHDVHTSILLGAAKIIYSFKHLLKNPVKLIFQPGEEMHPGGASILIKEGVLENPKVEKILALHVYPELEVGKVGFRKGMYMASSDELHIEIKGKGGHGALPENCVNPLEIGSEIILKVKELIGSMNTQKIPTVLSFGRFIAEGATNVIPEMAELKGTFRTMNEEWRENILKKISELVEEIGQKYGGQATLHRSKGYPCLVNDPQVTELFIANAINMLGTQNIEALDLRMTAEDFSFYSMQLPACFFRLGVRNEEQGIIHSVHSPNFDIDSKALEIGTKLLASIPFYESN